MAAKKSSGSRKKYGEAASKSVESAMHREKKGTLRSGKGGKGGKVTSRKQAIAIGLSAICPAHAALARQMHLKTAAELALGPDGSVTRPYMVGGSTSSYWS